VATTPLSKPASKPLSTPISMLPPSGSEPGGPLPPLAPPLVPLLVPPSLPSLMSALCGSLPLVSRLLAPFSALHPAASATSALVAATTIVRGDSGPKRTPIKQHIPQFRVTRPPGLAKEREESPEREALLYVAVCVPSPPSPC